MAITKANLDLLKSKFGIVGASPKMLEVFEMLFQVAPTELNVLITGETGTGKEVFANAIHQLSNRKKYPFISVNCGAIPETLLESELFGHEKGAFTGAYDQRKGFFEVADRGTIFLDEIGEMPIGTQVKLLRVLETGEFNRLGSTRVIKVDVRVIAATNRVLGEEIYRGNFRQDLYFRLKNVHIVLPPLREHPEDIPLLVEYFATKICNKIGIEYKGISLEALNILRGQSWPGNVRELKNLIETIIQLEKNGYIDHNVLRKYLPPALPPHSFYEQPKETSLVFLPKQDESPLGLELIFRSILELKKDIEMMKDSIDILNSKIDSLKNDFDDHLRAIEKTNKGLDLESEKLEDFEKKLIQTTLEKFHWNRRKTAKALGISERTLYRKLKEFGLS